MANRFRVFFTDKITSIRAKFVNCKPYILKPDISPPSFGTFKPVTEAETHKFIMSSPTKSCLLDPWPTFLVKDCIDILLPSITKLVNLSLVEGVFPSDFKHAVVTPLIKKSSLAKNELKNYRPVSGLCFISKLVERVVAVQMRDHLEEHKLGNDFQSAYKQGHSTETALLKIKTDIHNALSCGKSTCLVLLDLSAAFDTIDHDGLLENLSSWYGVSGTVLNWFSSYITDRYQCIKIENTIGAIKT